MRRGPFSDRRPAGSAAAALPADDGRLRQRGDWQTLAMLLPYLWPFRWRVALALGCMLAAKLANVGVPVVLKRIVDALTPGLQVAGQALAVPLALLAAYGVLRLSTTVFNELRELVFAKVTQRTVRAVSLNVFEHLHALSLRFHLERQTGGLTRDLERGSRGISQIVSYALYSIVPTLVEIALVLGYLALHYEIWFTLIALSALASYVAFTFAVTEWRTHFRRSMNELDSRASVRAVDSLLNYETVKYFNNEAYELRRYDDGMRRWERAAIRSQSSLSVLNVGQSAIIAIAVTLMVWRATVGVVEGRLTLGDLVLVNAFMIQLYAPLNFLGVLYREIKQSLTDMERMFTLLDANREVADAPDARPLRLLRAGHGGVGRADGGAAVGLAAAGGAPEIRFEHVGFAYHPDRPILRDLSFVVAPGTTTAVVGASGAGKSTIARLMFRFYDVTDGRILVDGQDLREITQASLRAAVGIVPQDTVLFNDTIGYNIGYGRTGAGAGEVAQAARAAQLEPFIASLPEGWDTEVGERGLKLSGGEKQRVAIARMLLKNPPILILDEATSALDSHNEQAIQQALRALASNRTSLVIAHRLSTIVDADQIIVLHEGRVVERGSHEDLLEAGGAYAQMWAVQADQARAEAIDGAK